MGTRDAAKPMLLKRHCMLSRVATAVILLLLPALAGVGGAVVELDIAQADVEAVVVDSGVVWLKLAPPATATLAVLTKRHQGQFLRVTLEGTLVLESRIFATVDSGILQIDDPSPQLLSRLEKIHGDSDDRIAPPR